MRRKFRILVTAYSAKFGRSMSTFLPIHLPVNGRAQSITTLLDHPCFISVDPENDPNPFTMFGNTDTETANSKHFKIPLIVEDGNLKITCR